MKYLLLILLFACGQKKQPHQLQVMAGYKDEKNYFGPTFTDGMGGKVTIVHHDKKHNRYDTIVIEVKRQKK